ncbi:MAG: type III-B CRISPR module-associated Cmr3 family protein, partial [Chloroflexota bacterium]
MTWLMMKPTDVWMFRDGQPFSAGEGHTARSLFPPTPFTVQGALRAHISQSLGVSLADYLSGNGNKAEKARTLIGQPARDKGGLDTGAFRMRGPFLANDNDGKITRYFPVPVDTSVHKDVDVEKRDAHICVAQPDN